MIKVPLFLLLSLSVVCSEAKAMEGVKEKLSEEEKNILKEEIKQQELDEAIKARDQEPANPATMDKGQVVNIEKSVTEVLLPSLEQGSYNNNISLTSRDSHLPLEEKGLLKPPANNTSPETHTVSSVPPPEVRPTLTKNNWTATNNKEEETTPPIDQLPLNSLHQQAAQKKIKSPTSVSQELRRQAMKIVLEHWNHSQEFEQNKKNYQKRLSGLLSNSPEYQKLSDLIELCDKASAYQKNCITYLQNMGSNKESKLSTDLFAWDKLESQPSQNEPLKLVEQLEQDYDSLKVYEEKLSKVNEISFFPEQDHAKDSFQNAITFQKEVIKQRKELAEYILIPPFEVQKLNKEAPPEAQRMLANERRIKLELIKNYIQAHQNFINGIMVLKGLPSLNPDERASETLGINAQRVLYEIAGIDEHFLSNLEKTKRLAIALIHKYYFSELTPDLKYLRGLISLCEEKNLGLDIVTPLLRFATLIQQETIERGHNASNEEGADYLSAARSAIKSYIKHKETKLHSGKGLNQHNVYVEPGSWYISAADDQEEAFKNFKIGKSKMEKAFYLHKLGDADYEIGQSVSTSQKNPYGYQFAIQAREDFLEALKELRRGNTSMASYLAQRGKAYLFQKTISDEFAGKPYSNLYGIGNADSAIEECRVVIQLYSDAIIYINNNKLEQASLLSEAAEALLEVVKREYFNLTTDERQFDQTSIQQYRQLSKFYREEALKLDAVQKSQEQDSSNCNIM